MQRVLAAVMLVCACNAQAASKDALQPQRTTQAPAADMAACDEHARLVDFAERQIAYIDSASVGDNSVYRETNRVLKMQMEQSQEQMHIEMMIALHCPLPTDAPRGGSRYFGAATNCSIARLKSPSSGAPPECDVKDWKQGF